MTKDGPPQKNFGKSVPPQFGPCPPHEFPKFSKFSVLVSSPPHIPPQKNFPICPSPEFFNLPRYGSNRHRFWAIAIWNLFLNNTPCTIGAKGTQRENIGSWIVCKTHSYLPQPQRVNLVLSMDKLKSFIVKIESHILWYSFIYLFLGSEKLKKYFINFIWTWTMNFNVKKSKNSNSCPLIVSLKSIVSCF